jgi:hypothetical protein
MYRVRFPRLGSLLGLLAILMVTLAPTVSQVLASHNRLGDALATYCTAEVQVAAPAQAGQPAHSTQAHWQACPYCSLIAHFTALPSSPAAVVAPPAARLPAATVVAAEVRGEVVHTAAQPRAPPVFS